MFASTCPPPPRPHPPSPSLIPPPTPRLSEAALEAERRADAGRSEALHSYRSLNAATDDDGRFAPEMEQAIKANLKERAKSYIQEFKEERAGSQLGEAPVDESVLPTLRDPKLFVLSCELGKERHLCFRLMRKFLDSAKAGKPMPIFSATTLDHVEGRIFVEARDKGNVMEVRGAVCGRTLGACRAPGRPGPRTLPRSRPCPAAGRAPCPAQGPVALRGSRVPCPAQGGGLAAYPAPIMGGNLPCSRAVLFA